MKNINLKFESLGALSSFIANTPVNGVFEGLSWLSSRDRGADFTGSESFEAANNMMLQGWSEGAKRVQKYMNEGVTASDPKRVIYNSVVGFAPNVPNYLSGNPLNMINQRRVKTPKKVVSIVYDCCVGGSIEAKELETTAAALFNVISGLEASGVRVELWAAMFDHYGNDKLNVAVKIKSAGQPFNLLKMIYPVVHPSFFRRHCFAVIERSEISDKKWVNGYGLVLKDKNEKIKACQALRIPSDNVFSYYDLAGRTEAEISKMIK